MKLHVKPQHTILQTATCTIIKGPVLPPPPQALVRLILSDMVAATEVGMGLGGEGKGEGRNRRDIGGRERKNEGSKEERKEGGKEGGQRREGKGIQSLESPVESPKRLAGRALPVSALRPELQG